ncbi:MAG: hypothetical protein FWD35_01120 [Oscillospiraceae bacterium]|nr:hypothetical protein [Oscillospiraceae bacterium]
MTNQTTNPKCPNLNSHTSPSHRIGSIFSMASFLCGNFSVVMKKQQNF